VRNIKLAQLSRWRQHSVGAAQSIKLLGAIFKLYVVKATSARVENNVLLLVLLQKFKYSFNVRMISFLGVNAVSAKLVGILCCVAYFKTNWRHF
jgi:hypothetical protein